MIRQLTLLLPALLAGCATAPTVYQPVANPVYSALGRNPFWMVSIGEDRIVLRIGRETAAGSGGAAAEFDEVVFPRTLPRTVDGVRTWESGQGTAVITIEARAGPCGDELRRFGDQVRVRLSGRELFGCGGPLLETGNR